MLGLLPQLLAAPIETLTRVARQHPGEVCSFYLGPVQAYLVTHPEHIQYVLADNSRNFVKGGMWKPMRRLLGNGLTTSDGDDWLRNRRLVQPLFVNKALMAYTQYMVDMVADAIPRFEAAADSGARVDMAREMMLLTEATLLKSMFSASMGVQEAERLGSSIMTAFKEMNLRVFLYFLPQQLVLPGELALRRAMALIDRTMFRLADERRRSGVKREDFLSLLLAARDDQDGLGMSDQQVRDELVTLIVAGTETTAIALTWLWYVLDRHPEVERKLRSEVDEVLGGRPPTFADLARLNYTRMVIMETLRLYPPAWFFPRLAHADDTIGGYFVPAGSPLLLSQYILHRDPAFWDDPERFDPERFTPERSAKRPRYAYLPFGGGARQCIGMQFALAEAQIITAMLVQRFRARMAPGARVVPQAMVTFRPRDGMPMVLTRA